MSRPRYHFNGAEQFVKDILVNTNTLESCDIEVCADAMSKYILFYPYYNNYRLLFDGKRCRLENEKLSLDADIITSKKSLKNMILNENLLNAFDEIYYSIGNMMPVVGNCKAGESDNWAYKMNLLTKYFEKNQELDENTFKSYQEGHISFQNTSQLVLWPVWVKKYWEDEKAFVNANFLTDIFPYKKEYKICDVKDVKEQFMIDTIKIIIQRSYRIIFGKSGSFTPTDEKNMMEIFGYFYDKYRVNLGNSLFNINDKDCI